jgi:hypothetical protein
MEAENDEEFLSVMFHVLHHTMTVKKECNADM